MALNEDCAIHVLELEKFARTEITSELERWLRFFKEGRELDDSALPDYMNTPEMRQAMKTLRLFSERERNYFMYQSRMDAIRVQKTLDQERERLERDNLRLESDNLRLEEEKEAALAREKVLMEKLRTLGINMDAAEVA